MCFSLIYSKIEFYRNNFFRIKPDYMNNILLMLVLLVRQMKVKHMFVDLITSNKKVFNVINLFAF